MFVQWILKRDKKTIFSDCWFIPPFSPRNPAKTEFLQWSVVNNIYSNCQKISQNLHIISSYNDNYKKLCKSRSTYTEEYTNMSISRRAPYLGLSYGSLWSILHLNLHIQSYKVQLTQKLQFPNHRYRRIYANRVIDQQVIDI